MKVQQLLVENTNSNVNNPVIQTPQEYNISFQAGFGGGLLNAAGGLMQGIEDQGFLASFLVQDVLGMTVPRVGAAFLRDKDVTGEYNIQEGFEVLGREGLTGPIMMAVAPIMFGLAAKFGRSTGVNTQLIRRYGNSFRDFIAKPEFNKALLKDKAKFRSEFYRANIEEILANTIGKEHVTEESIQFILKEMANYQNIPKNAKLKGLFGKKNYRKQCIRNITDHINSLKLSASSDLEMLEKVKVGNVGLNNIKSFSTKDAIEALMKYSDDAITLNKHLSSLDEAMAENIKDASIAKRFITNIGTMGATLGVMSVLPKIYARNAIAPGARTAMQLEEAKKEEEKAAQSDNKTDSEVSFKGKGKPKSSWLAKLGKWLSGHTTKGEKFAGELEYNGHNFTPTLMAGLSLFGLLAPRGMRAYNRAQVDENGKKDLTELYEILIRDITSSLSVVFAVPMLTRAFVTSYENKSGFVLMHKDRSKKGIKTAIDLINPYSSTHVLTNAEISALYNNVDSIEKMGNFCKYIDKNGGDLYKILSKSEHAGELFTKDTLELSKLANLTKKDRNKQIISFVEKLGKDGKTEERKINEIIAKVMKNSAKPKNNKIMAFARGLNSLPGVIATFIISPVILGWIIPRLTYANTRRIHENRAKEREEQRKLNTAA